MEIMISISTVSGRAYYELVTELKRKHLPFLSMKPWDVIPSNIEVVITTSQERHFITHPKVLSFDYESDPERVIDEAILVAEGKRNYDKIVIGIDPGKTCGITVLGDGRLLKSIDCSSLEETVREVLKSLDKVPANLIRVKVGNGPSVYSRKILRLLDDALPNEAIIEVISETGTSQPMRQTPNRRELKNVMAATEISKKKGRIFPRKKYNGAYCSKRENFAS